MIIDTEGVLRNFPYSPKLDEDEDEELDIDIRRHASSRGCTRIDSLFSQPDNFSSIPCLFVKETRRLDPRRFEHFAEAGKRKSSLSHAGPVIATRLRLVPHCM